MESKLGKKDIKNMGEGIKLCKKTYKMRIHNYYIYDRYPNIKPSQGTIHIMILQDTYRQKYKKVFFAR